jgi:hypothetical protein
MTVFDLENARSKGALVAGLPLLPVMITVTVSVANNPTLWSFAARWIPLDSSGSPQPVRRQVKKS